MNESTNPSQNSPWKRQEIIQLAKRKFEGKISRFPNNFWNESYAKDHARIVLKYFIEEELQLTIEEVPYRISLETFRQYGLSGMIRNVFGSSLRKALSFVYPNQLQDWPSLKRLDKLSPKQVKALMKDKIQGKLFRFPVTFWGGSHWKEYFIIAVKYYFEEYLHWSEETIASKSVTRDTLKNTGLITPISKYFCGVISQALRFVYPNLILSWYPKEEVENFSQKEVKEVICARFEGQIRRFPINFWACSKSYDYFKKAINILFDDYLNWDFPTIQRSNICKILTDYGLAGAIECLFDGDFSEAMKMVYPNYIPKRFSLEEIKQLSNNEVLSIIKANFSGKISQFPENFWGSSRGKEFFKVALRYLIKDIYEWEIEEIPEKLSMQCLIDYSLHTPIFFHYGSYIDGVLATYPGKFTYEQFSSRGKINMAVKSMELTEEQELRLIQLKIQGKIDNFPSNFWKCLKGKQRFRLALKVLFEDELRWSKDEVMQKITRKILINYGLEVPFQMFCDSSCLKTVKLVYPKLFEQNRIPDLAKRMGSKNIERRFSKRSRALSEKEVLQIIKKRLDCTISRFPKKFFHPSVGKERIVLTVKYFLEDHLKIPINKIPTKVTHKLFSQYRLAQLVLRFFDSLFEIINYIYPDRFTRVQLVYLHHWNSQDKPIILSYEEVKRIFTDVLEGNIVSFPKRFWCNVKSRDYFSHALKFLLEDYYQITINKLSEHKLSRILQENNLYYPVNRLFGSNLREAFNYTYPNFNLISPKKSTKKEKSKINPLTLDRGVSMSDAEVRMILKKRFEGKIDSYPPYFWKCREGKERLHIALKKFFEDHLQWKVEEIPKKVSSKILDEVGLNRPIRLFYNNYAKAIVSVYPNKIREWHFRNNYNGIWKGEDGKARSLVAMREMIEDLNIPPEEIPKRVKAITFKKYGLSGMLGQLYNYSPYQAINTLYPNMFKPWEFEVRNYWQKQTIAKAREATKWLIEKKLKLTKADILQGKVKYTDFTRNGLSVMLQLFYNNKMFKALDDVYQLQDIIH